MKKIYLMIIALTVLCLFGCTTDDVDNNDKNSNTINTDKKPSELEAKDIIYAYIKKLNDNKCYESTTTGYTKAKKGFISYNQEISSSIIKNNDEYYYDSYSSSTLVNLKHLAYFKDNMVRYSHNSEEIKEITLEEYRKTYGITPMDVSIGGYLIDESTILEATKEQDEDNIKVVFYLDNEKATNNMKIQMKQFGSLSDYPKFKSLKFTLLLDNKWKPISLINETEYTITIGFLGEMDCKQNITTTFNFDVIDFKVL